MKNDQINIIPIVSKKLNNATKQVTESIDQANPELDKNLTELMTKLAVFITTTNSENVPIEKSQSNIAMLTLFLEQMNSFGANELLDNTLTQQAKYLKNPAGVTAVKKILDRI